MSAGKKTSFEQCREDFSEALSLAQAMEIVWSRSTDESETDQRGMFQHYTTLNRVLEKIITRRWWLTRCDSKKLNDLKEAEKYGRSRKELVHRTYIMCFGNGSGENVAMWGLYTNNDPFAMRISLPRKTVNKWMGELASSVSPDVQDTKGGIIEHLKLELPKFHDLIYVAVQDKEIVDEFDIRRTNTISWESAKCKLDKKYDLESEIKREEYAGWLKDYEWHHERESRLCIRLKKKIKDDAISIAIPEYVIDDMRFTFSPWLVDEAIRGFIQSTILAALKSSGVKLSSHFQRFRRSVLTGALNFKA